MLIKLALTLGITAFAGGSDTETFQCEVTPLAEYGFEQVSNDHPEYVCVNPNDYTDFIILESPHELDTGDMMRVELENGEVVSQHRLESLNSL